VAEFPATSVATTCRS